MDDNGDRDRSLLPRLQVNKTDFKFKDEWKQAFGAAGGSERELGRTEGAIDSVENKLADAASTAQDYYNFINNFYDANINTIQNAIDITAKNADLAKVNGVLNNFQEAAAVLVKGLDELGKLHPFIGVAVLSFKLVYVLDSSRRDNNKKVLAIKVQMKEMMLTLFQLRHVKDSDEVGPDGTTIAGRMQSLIKNIAEEIKACGSDCDAYLKKGLLAKTFKSKFYEPKLASYGDLFIKRRDDIQFALSLHTAVGVVEANVKLDSVSQKMKSVEEKLDTLLLFRKLDTPRELDLQRFMEENGGIKACLDSPKLLAGLIKRDEPPSSSSSSTYDARNLRDAKKVLIKELNEDVELTLKRNYDLFSRKLEAQSRQIESVKDVVYEQGERIINVILGGSHRDILDKDLQRIWQIGSWKGSVKARHFVLALYDYYSQHQDEITAESSVTSPISAVSAAAPSAFADTSSSNAVIFPIAATLAVKGVRSKHSRWALAFVNVAHLQPLIEAIDDDGTGFVTIKEVNDFATGRPEGCSLLSWLAYWASGWHLSITQYHFKIHQVFIEMFTAAKHVLPVNYVLVNRFLDNDTTMGQIELILRGTKHRQDSGFGGSAGKLAENQLKGMTEQYEKTEEDRLKDMLEMVKYDVDTVETVALITGPGRIEKFIFPLFYLLLKRYLKIIILASVYTLEEEELANATTSITNVLSIVRERSFMLEAIFRQISADVKARFSHFAYGMFSAFNDPAVKMRRPKDLTFGAFYYPGRLFYGEDEGLPDTLTAHHNAALALGPGILRKNMQKGSEDVAHELDSRIRGLVVNTASAPAPIEAETSVTFPLPSFSQPEVDLVQPVAGVASLPELVLDAELSLSSPPSQPESGNTIPYSNIEGTWTTHFPFVGSGFYESWHGLVQLHLKFVDHSPGSENLYSIIGEAQNSMGSFDVSGRYFPITNRVTLVLRRCIPVTRPIIHGVLNVEEGTINGTWYPFPADEVGIEPYETDEYSNFEDRTSTHLYFIMLTRTPAHLYRFRNVEHRGVLSLARLRWSFAFGAILHEVRRKAWSWRYFKYMCMMRRRLFRWRLSTIIEDMDYVAYHPSMESPLKLWDYRRLRPDVIPADAQFYINCLAGSEDPSEAYRADEAFYRLTTMCDEEDEMSAVLKGRWGRAWVGHLFYYHVTAELIPWHGLTQLQITSFDKVVDGRVSVMGEGFSQRGRFVMTGHYDCSNETMFLLLNLRNSGVIGAKLTLDERSEKLSGIWKLLVNEEEDQWDFSGYDLLSYESKSTAYFSRTVASLHQFHPPFDTSYIPVLEHRNLNQARERWTFAISAVLHQVRQESWSWRYFKARFDQRRHFLDCVKRESMEAHSGFNKLDVSWQGVVDGMVWIFPPADGHLYEDLIQLEFRKRQNHEARYRCDGCNNKSLMNVRFLCLKCIKPDLSEEVDLCEGCVNQERFDTADFTHDISHPLLKCSKYVFEHQTDSIVRQALAVWTEVRSDFKAAKGSRESTGTLPARRPDQASGIFSHSEEQTKNTVPQCTYCCRDIETTPFWVCTECTDDSSNIYVCCSCSIRHPATIPQPSCSAHSSAHRLVRVYDLIDDTNKANSGEDSEQKKWADLEAKLNSMESALGSLVPQDRSRISDDMQPKLTAVENRLGVLEQRMGRMEGILQELAKYVTSTK